MNNYERLFADVYFYSREYEDARRRLDEIRSAGTGDNALLRAEREVERLKSKLDALCEKLPEEK